MFKRGKMQRGGGEEGDVSLSNKVELNRLEIFYQKISTKKGDCVKQHARWCVGLDLFLVRK